MKDGPYEFALDVVDNRLIVIDIFPGGIIHRHGGVLVDDELLELDGVKLNPDDFYDCVHKLEIVLEDKTHVTIYQSIFFLLFYILLILVEMFRVNCG